MTSAAPVADYAFYEKVAKDAGRNITLSLVGLGLMWWLANVSLFAAKGVFWLGAVLNALNTLHVLAFTAIGIVAFVAGSRESKWSWAANVARLIEIVICGLVVWWSAGIVGYR